MELQIRTNGTKVTEGMREFINERMAKVDRLVDKVTDAQLELRTESTRTDAEITTAQITLKTGRQLIRAEAEAAEPARAIDIAIDRLITQVRKVSDKRKTRRKRAGRPEFEMPAAQATEPGQDGALDADMDVVGQLADEDLVARTKRFQMEPMDVEMAIEQMELIGHDFFFFKNEEDETFSVLYRRRDGTYGILSPE